MTQTPEQLASTGFFFVGYNDNVKCYFCDGGLNNWESDDESWTEHACYFPACGFLRQVKGTRFIQQVQDGGINCVPILSTPLCLNPPCDNGVSTINVLNQHEKASMKEIQRETTLSVSVVNGDKLNTGDIKSLENEYDKLKNQKLCKICMDGEIVIVFIPCGHFVSCEKCARALNNCPICREFIKDSVKTFMS